MSQIQFPTLGPPAARAAAGARFLDTVQPDWLDHVDEMRLDIALNDRCVLGQLGARIDPECADSQYVYQVAIDTYRLHITELFQYGFMGELDEIDDLNFAWVSLIAIRRTMLAVAARAGVEDVEVVDLKAPEVHVHHVDLDDDLVVLSQVDECDSGIGGMVLRLRNVATAEVTVELGSDLVVSA